ncbi:MAG TPA: TolC family protein [Edaphobacter sp.]|nr:TolC family protein [Edaphobacter sp.]
MSSIFPCSLWPLDCFPFNVHLRWFLIVFLFSLRFATAQQPDPKSDSLPPPTPTEQLSAVPLTLDEALKMADRSSPRLHAANALLDRATATTQIARAYTNPNVEFYAGKQSARNIPTPGIPGLLQHYAASQTIEIPRERALRRTVADLARTGQSYQRDSERLSVTASVKNAFYEALRWKHEVEYARENLALVQGLRNRVEVEVRVGEKGRLELTRAEAELARANFAVRSAQINLANAIAVLRAVIAGPPDVPIDPRGDLEPPVRLAPLNELRTQVLRDHPVIAEANTAIEQAQTELDHQRSLRVPQPTFYGEWEKQPDLTFWRLGVNVPLPLWDRHRGQIADSQAAIRQSAAIRNQRQLELTSALERAYESYQLADQQATSLQAGSMHEAESAVDAAMAAYRFGERGIVEVLDAQRVLQSVRGDLLDARFARQAALVDLEELGVVPSGEKH